MKIVKYLPFSLLLLIAACAKPVYYSTPSSKPEVTITGADSKVIRGEILNEMINRGYSLKNETSTMLIFDKRIDNAFAAAMFGSRYDPNPNVRVVYNTIDVSNQIRIVASFLIVTNPNSSFERTIDANNNADTQQFMDFLIRLKNKYSKT